MRRSKKNACQKISLDSAISNQVKTDRQTSGWLMLCALKINDRHLISPFCVDARTNFKMNASRSKLKYVQIYFKRVRKCSKWIQLALGKVSKKLLVAKLVSF